MSTLREMSAVLPLSHAVLAITAGAATRDAMRVANMLVIVYFIVVNSSYVLLIALAGLDIVHDRRRPRL
jgi:hypothetical protein